MPVFILENISKTFKVEKNKNTVLKEINFIFPETGLISIIGKSGCGKSTLLNILLGIEKPTTGKVLFEGKDISKYSDRKFSKYHLSGVSAVFQHYNLFEDLSVLENIIIPLRMKGIRRKKAARIAQKNLITFKLENFAKRKVKNLSGGEKQRIAIIRSIITSPKVLLCDEPTGALDSKNSHEIMEILRDLSRKMLIIMVSHNATLVNEFSDEIITLIDGKISNKKVIKNIKNKNEMFDQKSSYRESWILMFLKNNLKRNFLKNIFSIISCCLGLSSILLCVGFSAGSKKSQNEALLRNLSVGYATVSSVETVTLKDSPLDYTKTRRPEIIEIDEEFNDFTTIRFENNISYLISNYPTCVYENDTFSNFQMVPVYDLSLKKYGSELISEGRATDNSFDEIIVNKEFEKLLGKSLLNKTIIFKNCSTVNFKTGDNENPLISDSLYIEKPMKIVGIINEFPFLNTPKIYYSYFGGVSFLKSQTMEKVSSFLNKPYSFYDYFDYCDNDDVVTSYSSYLFLNDLSESEKFFERIKSLKNNNLEVTSQIFDIKETYTTFISSFSKALIVFSIICFIGVNLILGMISLSSFLENKKKAAILTCLGSKNSSIHKIHLFENYLIVGIAFICSLFLSNFLQRIINPYVSKEFGLSNLITIPFESFLGIKYGLVIILASITVISSALFTIIPMLIYRNGFICEELRDE